MSDRPQLDPAAKSQPAQARVDPPQASSSEKKEPRNQLTERFPAANLTVLAHFYRGEVARANIWRTRMDITTNWAIVSATAAISVAFSAPQPEAHMILPFASLIVFLLLHIEGRRYRFYDVWRTRVRMLECHMLVPTLLPEMNFVEGNWRQVLADDLLMPTYKMSYSEAVARRLTRNYLWIFGLLLVAWLVKVLFHQDGTIAPSWSHASERFGWGSVSPAWVIGAQVLLHAGLIVLVIQNIGVREATGEIRRHDAQKKSWPV